MYNFYIMGNDKRQNNLRKMYNASLSNSLELANVVVLPTPLSKDGINITGEDICVQELLSKLKNKIVFAGKISPKVREYFDENNVEYYDLMEIEELAIKNAIPTAEGTIAKIMELTETTIFETNILILGFGKCGKILADRLKGMGAHVFCEARAKKDLAQIRSMGYNYVDINELKQVLPQIDVIVNTVPFMILNKERLDCIKEGALIIDIASAPGGTDFNYCKEKRIKAILELAIPSIAAPISSSKYIKEVIDKTLEERL